MIKITVTQEDIDNGERCLSSKCALALAAKRTFNNPRARVVVPYIIEIPDPLYRGLTEKYILSQDAINFVTRFDAGEHVEPIEIEVRNIFYPKRK